MKPMRILAIIFISTGLFFFLPGLILAGRGAEGKNMQTTENIYSFKAKALDGREIDFKQYQGKVLLIVNTASKCGFTRQYEGLEQLHKKYAQRGLQVLGFPCNQFGGQEPGNSEEIAGFCQRNYGVDFQMFQKI